MLKELLLKKGWAGKTISRSETVERLNPIIRRHIELNNDYDFAIRRHPSTAVREALASTQNVARANVGKLAETVYSCGGVAYTGVDLEPSNVDLGSDGGNIVDLLLKGERSLVAMIEDDESRIEHQMRTRAILEAVLSSARQRLDLLERLTRSGS